MTTLGFDFDYKTGLVTITKPNGEARTWSWPIQVSPIRKDYIPTGEEIFRDLCEWLVGLDYPQREIRCPTCGFALYINGHAGLEVCPECGFVNDGLPPEDADFGDGSMSPEAELRKAALNRGQP